MAQLLTRVEGLINPEVAKITGSKEKEAACLMKQRDVSGGFTSDSLLNGPDIMFDQIETGFRSFLTLGTVTSYLLACCFLPVIKVTKDAADTGSHRANGGSSLILKVFEKVTLVVWGYLLSSDTVQFGSKQKTMFLKIIITNTLRSV